MFNEETESSRIMTTTETKIDKPYISPVQMQGDDDDYSVAPNYKEETNYNTVKSETIETEKQTKTRGIYAPVITKKQEERPETVTLTKEKQVIRLSGRLKIVLAMFVTIMVSLISLICYNFVAAGQINSTLDAKEARIVELQTSINSLTEQYNELTDDEYLYETAEELGYVVADESNTVVIKLGDMYERQEIQEIPSNWFNDVCEFFSKLFG